jgi:formylglycine-generating enzyme required for sulfatase activity
MRVLQLGIILLLHASAGCGDKDAAPPAPSKNKSPVTVADPRWLEATRSIADKGECPKYDAMRIAPQTGLVPIGRDPASGFWEFAHLPTTATGVDPVPKRDGERRLVVTESTGLIFVLIPGGSFRMGATKPAEGRAPTAPNVDSESDDDESPVTDVRLDPFFLSKYEMTQSQWVRVTGGNPSGMKPGEDFGGRIVTALHPVEQISWNDCDLWLGRLDLILPTEAQWEYAARGGTTTSRWTGTGKQGIGEAANVADESWHDGVPDHPYEAWNDGYTVHAPVGSFAPNPFGLHDVLGNVSEWCRDRYGGYESLPDAGDGLRHPADSSDHVERGGSFNWGASQARSASRGRGDPTHEKCPGLGVRPARSLQLVPPAGKTR